MISKKDWDVFVEMVNWYGEASEKEIIKSLLTASTIAESTLIDVHTEKAKNFLKEIIDLKQPLPTIFQEKRRD